MSVALTGLDVRAMDAGAISSIEFGPRTRKLLHGPIVPTLLRMAWPNVLVMLAQAATGLIETWFVSKLGTDALAGMALVFPGVMLMQMISAGAMGGGISSAIARALGAGRRDQADALVLHALIVNVALGASFSVIMLAFGRPIYRALGGEGGQLDAALSYSNVVFAGSVLLWALNGLANVIRGTGNMLVPASVICVGVVVLLPLSPLLIFGIGPFPALGIAGGGVALIAFYAAGTAVLAWYVLSGRNLARLRPARLRWPLFRDILRVGAVASVTSVQTNVIIALATALVATAAGPAAAAGYGTGARLEYLLVPLVFGLGAPLVAMVGTNIGAGQRERALRVAFVGGAIAFAITEAIGIAAALWPNAWISLFSADPRVIAAATGYLRVVGPFYGFFGLALALYFASQGAGRLFWPLTAGFLRMLVAIGGGWLALRLSGSLTWLFAALALGLLLQGLTLAAAIGAGAWFRGAVRWRILAPRLELGEIQPTADGAEHHADRQRRQQHPHDPADDAHPRGADQPRDRPGCQQNEKRDREHAGQHADGEHLSGQIEAIVIGKQDHREHGAGSGDLGDRQRIDRERERALSCQLGVGVGLAAQHLERDQEQQDAAGDLEGADRDAHLLQQEGAGKHEEDQDDERDHNRVEGELALGAGIELAGQRQENRQHAERIDDQEQGHELADVALPPHGPSKSLRIAEPRKCPVPPRGWQGNTPGGGVL